MNSSRRMTEIKYITFGSSTFDGTAEGDHGVFTRSNGDVYAGEIAGDSARVGVATRTNGTTSFVECDANGKEHGRVLDCWAGGRTRYRRCEHGNYKEDALLYADGTCEYNSEACRADYAPFVALRAMVVPIKARRPLVPPHSQPLFMPPFSPPPPPDPVQSAIVLACAGAGDGPRREGAHLPPAPSVACTARATQPTAAAKEMHRASNLDDAPCRKGSLRM
jgi:hypothetical protein